MSESSSTSDFAASTGVRKPTVPSSPSVAEPADQDGADEPIDLDAVERDLNDVETALGRLDDGTYWTDEVTGEEIPDEILTENPAARSA